jgi:hypothetical protein
VKKNLALLFCLVVPAEALAIEVEGKQFGDVETIAGKRLELIGAAVRQKWVFDVYAFGAWTESGQCDTAALINTDEVKYIRLEMLRDVDAERMASNIGKSFDNNMPPGAPAALAQQRKTFQSYFKEEAKEGQRIEFIYVPGTGMTLKQNGKQLGPPLAGFEFTKVFWSIYFSDKTCCEDLKTDLLKMCKK